MITSNLKSISKDWYWMRLLSLRQKNKIIATTIRYIRLKNRLTHRSIGWDIYLDWFKEWVDIQNKIVLSYLSLSSSGSFLSNINNWKDVLAYFKIRLDFVIGLSLFNRKIGLINIWKFLRKIQWDIKKLKLIIANFWL